jgi:pimeloyl-ACP methyl ester carboxylesterase
VKHTTDTATIDWEEHGEGQPIVFLHGLTMNRQIEMDVYEPIFSAREGWRRIYPDLPGMGRSIGKTIGNQDDILAAMLAFLDHRLAGTDRHGPPGHDRGLSRRLGHPRELSARHLRGGRPGDPWLAGGIERSAGGPR